MDYNSFRRKSRKIFVGKVGVGGDSPLSVQSMTNVPSGDFPAVYAQMKALEASGCDIVRMTVPDASAVSTLSKLKESDLTIPIVADIHFNYRLALDSVSAGADKIRINPGNIGGPERIRAVVRACSASSIPIRIGVNGGSLEKDILAKFGSPTAEALVASASYHVSLLERFDFTDIIVAVKSSDVRTVIAANRLLSEKFDYPLHLGVTESGTYGPGLLRSCTGIGSLLCDGIGDTLRVSLTADPLVEVREGRALLRALGFDARPSVRIVSCPTCGRTKIDLISIASELEERLLDYPVDRPLTLAVMGCAVNGPGEAREADLGIAGGDGDALLFEKGRILRKIPESGMVDALLAELDRLMGRTR